jgi:hypothetical protein
VIREPKRHKYGVAPRAERTDREGNVFDSKGEMVRWEELRLLQKAGRIRKLERQVHFLLEVKGVKIATYTADFTYEEKVKEDREGVYGVPAHRWEPIVEDFKGLRTQVYLMKRRLMKAIYGIEIRETGVRPRVPRVVRNRRGHAKG